MASCNWQIAALPGISAEQQALLKDQGIQTTHQLLLATRSPQDRYNLESRLKLHPNYLKKWVALADLARLPSVGTDYCGLVLHSGVASVNQLAQTPFSRLHRNIVKLQVAHLQQKDLAPSLGLVKQWVAEARQFL
ncbi:hypothetical protein NIES970_04750 [[Synechococcus] sp. NIES-970]|uniref:DUF4332 domain-containing protein n=1 Tax=Picosynechococcus sp. NKBG15041c TaxID=1407650 RepID=UPI0004180580|nr:DUF4332 domain-containing protein [Picosynechococcus sp. NKBG15041c]BAW95566.1 hypothetical protein NIES970_04750 [[Synechococcus] sp. NIES-970]